MKALIDMTLIKNGQFNIGHICTKMQCDLGFCKKIAMRFISSSMESSNYSFEDIEKESNRLANTLGTLGFKPGDILFTFLPKAPEQFFTILGCLKARLIAGTLFPNFGEEALLDRLGDSGARGILTKKSLLKKILAIKGHLPALEFIILTDIDTHISENILSYNVLTRQENELFDTPLTDSDTPSLLHYTSGSTGKPKGVLHTHNSVISQNDTARKILDLKGDDIYWCTADQGWVTGTSYGIIGPWSTGTTQIHFAGAYNPESWFTILEHEKVTVWYTAPTALRMLMRQPASFFVKYDIGCLRHVFSVGEPLNPEVISWAKHDLGKEVYDTWFQTETGAIMIANRPGIKIKPGSMGKPADGIAPSIRDDNGIELSTNSQGNLCLNSGWPSMFVTYLKNDEGYQNKFHNGYYYTGDKAYRDEDGYYWFMGRNDDIINTAGHLVSPFEVESALIEMQEIAESGVVGIPDDLLYEKIIAFVALHKGIKPTPELELKIRLYVTHKLSSFAAPQVIQFLPAIPKNKSGKIMRRVLRSNYLGIDAGDTSTLEI